MLEIALVDVGERQAHVGVTARELLELSGNLEFLSASSLEAWLLDEGLAEPNGAPDRLVPTQRAFEIIGLLDFFG